MVYTLAPTNSDIMHYGVSVKDGSPGRGSGRYPLGSGKDGQKAAKYAKRASRHAKYKSYISGEGSSKENIKIAKKNAKAAFKTVRDNAKVGISRDRKVANGLKDEINYKEVISNDILNQAIGEITIAKVVAGEKAINRAMNMTASLNTIGWHTAIGFAGSIPSSVKNARARSYIKSNGPKVETIGNTTVASFDHQQYVDYYNSLIKKK